MFGRDIERYIRDYISEIDFANENFSITQIKNDLRKILDNEPAIHIKRVKYSVLNEATNRIVSKEQISTVTISYIDGETDDGHAIVKRLPLIVG
jgi:hypothetical protein